MVAHSLQHMLRDLVHELAIGNLHGLEQDGRAGRLRTAELQYAITTYGRTIIDLPDEAFHYVDYYYSEQNKYWHIDIDLWTAEEGRSDLTLSVMITEKEQKKIIQILDLHVM